MALDMKAWLLEQGVKPDAVDAMLPGLEPARDNIEKATLRQSDYSAKQAALQAKQTELDSANDRLNTEMIEWATTQRAGEPITEKMRNDLAAARGEVTRLQSVITSKATELGLDPKTVIGEVTPPAVVVPQAPSLDGYARTDDINARMGRFADYMMMLPAEIEAIRDEHFDTTGERLDTRPIMAEVRRRAGDKSNFNTDGTPKKPIDARSIWEETHGIAEKRTAKAEAAQVARDKAAEERGYERARTEQAIPGREPAGRHSLVLKRPEGSAPKLARGAPVAQLDRISQAASSLATHRYRKTG